jgi:hypothetical protein
MGLCLIHETLVLVFLGLCDAVSFGQLVYSHTGLCIV